MTLDERKKRILKAIIDDYIETAEPIGSRSVAKKHELGLSSATIRNEMSDLEELGFLVQPHTSAGRVPSDKGYRLYVDQLMNVTILTINEINSIKEAMEIKISELNQIIRQASLIMSQITRYTSMAITPRMNEARIKAIQVVPIDPMKVLVIVVANAGVVKNCMMQMPRKVEPDLMIRISNILNDKFGGIAIQQVKEAYDEVKKAAENDEDIIKTIFNGIQDCLIQLQDDEVYFDGATNIFEFPEFRDVFKAREFLNMLDAKEVLHDLLNRNDSGKGVRVKIGAENDFDGIKDYSLVTATYSFNNSVLGSIGIIGPTRMEYSKVISSLNYMRSLINDDLSRILSEEKDNNDS